MHLGLNHLGLNGFSNQFSPLSLFANSEQGAWYDPSDFSSLYQDSVGTTPVTALEQSVGLMLDKRYNLARGTELVSNGTFDTDLSGWSAATGFAGTATWNNGSIRIDTGTSDIGYGQGVTTVVGQSYELTFTVVSGSASAQMYINDQNNGSTLLANITCATARNYRYVFVASTTTTYLIMAASSVGGIVIFDNISFKSIRGNHASQSTSGSRPVVSARFNQFTSTEDFSVAGWTKSSATASASVITATATFGAVYQTVSKTAAAVSWKIYCEFAAGTASTARLTLAESTISTAGVGCDFTLTGNGVAGAPAAYGTAGWVAGTASIQSLGGGWYACTLTGTTSTSASISGVVGHASTAVNGNTLSARKADLRLTADTLLNIPKYQRVNTATDYDSSGFPVYLKADGFDDGMVTNTIDFTGTDKVTVWAAVTKLSDAAGGEVVELSASPTTTAGTFTLLAPTNTLTNYTWRSRGSLDVTVSGNNYPAPATKVLTGIGDIASDICTLRVNGAVDATSSSDQGTGTFSSNALYLFRRGGSSSPFNGRFYGGIIRGAASNTTQISKAEQYMASKCALSF